MNLKQLDTFLWVVALKSFRKTAEKLNATQPAISTRIANLEEELGVKLFERDTGSVRLTQKGQEILPYVEKVLRVSEILREKASGQAVMSGILRLGASETIVHTWLPQFLKKIHDLYPNVDLELTVDVTKNLRKALMLRTLDLVFLLGPISEHSITNTEISEFPLSWVCAPSLFSGIKGEISMEHIIQFPVMTYARSTRPYSEAYSYFKNNFSDPVRIFSSTSISALIKMARDGLGIALIAPAVVQKELASGELIEINVTWRPSPLLFTASYCREPYNSLIQNASDLAKAIADDYK